jgi:hypothetical protein
MLLSVIELVDILKKKEGFSDEDGVNCKIKRIISNVTYFIIFLVLALKFRKCYFSEDKLHLVGALFFPQLYVLYIMIFSGKFCPKV